MGFLNLSMFNFQRACACLSVMWVVSILSSSAYGLGMTPEDQIKDQAKASLHIQFKDMSLIDCSDIRGVCAMKHITSGKYWKNPPVFLVKPPRPGEFTFCIIGSMQYMPLQVLGGAIDDVFADAEHLITTTYLRGRLTRAFLEDLGAITNTQDEYDDFIHALTHRQKIIFEAETAALLSYFNIPDVKPYEIFNQYMLILRSQLYHAGMDMDIATIMEADNKPVQAIQEIKAPIQVVQSLFPEWKMDLRMSIINSSDFSIKNFSHYEILFEQILQCNYSCLLNDTKEPECVAFNFTWLTYLMNNSKIHRRSIAVVEMVHLLGRNSVLSLLRDSGYKITYIGARV